MERSDLILLLESQGWTKKNAKTYTRNKCNSEYRCILYLRGFKFQSLFNGKYTTFNSGLYIKSFFNIQNTGASNIHYPYLNCSW